MSAARHARRAGERESGTRRVGSYSFLACPFPTLSLPDTTDLFFFRFGASHGRALDFMAVPPYMWGIKIPTNILTKKLVAVLGLFLFV